MKPGKFLPPILIYSIISTYLIGGFVESISPAGKGFWRKLYGPLTFDLGAEPTKTGYVMLGLDILCLFGLIYYITRLKRREEEEAAHGKVTQDQGPFGG